MSQSFGVAAGIVAYHGNGLQLLYLLLEDAQAALHAVGPVGGELQAQGEEFELVFQTLHVRVVLFHFIEYEVAFAVQRFQIGLDAGRLVSLAVFIGMDIQLYARLFLSHLGHEGLEYLLEKRSWSLLFSI